MKHEQRHQRLRILVGLLAALAPAVPALWPNAPVSVRLLTVPTFYWLCKVLYDQWPQFYLAVTRLRLWILNGEVAWTMAIDFESPSTSESVDGIVQAIREAYPKAQVWGSDPLMKTMRLPMLGALRIQATELSLPFDEEEPILSLQFTDFVVPFRHSNKVLEALISLLNDKIKPIVRPSREKYAFTVRFGGPNPYYGLFLRQLNLPKQELIAFNCEFVDRIRHKKETVQVSQDGVALVAHDLLNLQSLARRYVTLSTGSLTSP